MSDWSGVIVQNCALQLLYQHDQVQFEQELKHCNNLISENRKLVCKQQEHKKKINEQYHVDEGLQRKFFSNIDFEVKIFPRLIDQPETDETEIQLSLDGLNQQFLQPTTMVSPRNHRRNSVDFVDTAHFLRACFLCKRRLFPGHDIYMYRYNY